MFNFSQPEVVVDEKKIDELLTRGIENIFPSREFLKSKMMRGERVSLYLGIDPTGPTLHLGHVIPIIKLGKFQELGHQITLLMGDFTGMIGDPTDKSATRKKLSHEEVMQNQKEYQKQASRIISFSGPNKALFKFNSEWLGKLSFSDVVSLASEMTVQQMLERDMFQKRMQEGRPVYLHEFLYPLMQGYDCVAMGVDGEIGGNDQTFNMLTGRNLMKSLKNKEKFVVATKLLADPEGKKMGKTENNMVSLNQTAEEMFGKIMSWSDGMIIPAFELLTDVSTSEILSMKNSLEGGDNPKGLKVRLAQEVVSRFHGEKRAEVAKENFDNTFAKGGVPEDVVETEIANGILFSDALIANGLVASRNEFRRLVSEGAVTNMETGERTTDPNVAVSTGMYKIGKRRFIKIKVL